MNLTMCSDEKAGTALPRPPQAAVDIREQSPLALAFVGDGVLELLVRARLAATRRLPASQLHRQAVRLVSARAQHAYLPKLLPLFTEEETAVLHRGRNATKGSAAKNASPLQYRASTGLEALLGWLYLQGRAARLEELFEVIWAHYLAEE